MSSQPIIGNADYPQDLYLAHGAELVGEPEVDETAEIAWVPVDETPVMIARGEILGAITIIGVQHALLRRAVARVPPLRSRGSPGRRPAGVGRALGRVRSGRCEPRSGGRSGPVPAARQRLCGADAAEQCFDYHIGGLRGAELG